MILPSRRRRKRASRRRLKEQADGIPAPPTIRFLCSKLKLSPCEAGRLFKVGESAFDKYERGLVEPSGPRIQLITLLDGYPELLKDVR